MSRARARASAGDPVEEHLTALDARLRGPARAKGRLIEEMRDGLRETTEAHTRAGVPYRRAARLAVAEFGTADALVPSCQRELTIAQARHTARAVALTTPLLIACWLLAVTTGEGRAGGLPRTAQPAAVVLAGVAALAVLVAVTALAATGTLGRRLPTPPRLPLAVAWTGTAASAATALTALALGVVSAVGGNGPLLAVAGALAAASHAVVAASARACRRCARLSPAPAAHG